MLKNKILKLIPIWLTTLILITAVQTGIFYLSSATSGKTKNIQEVSATINTAPAVLGESTFIRGLPDQPEKNKTIEKIGEPDTSAVSAKSFLVFNLGGGQTLLEKNSTQRHFIASLTKLLTAFVAYQNSDLNQILTISAKDPIKIKPNLNLTIGDKIKALDLFNAMLVGSCNDAALALGHYVSAISQQDFASLMNQQATALGMTNSNFSNPAGFDSKNNYSTAEDLKILISATQQLAVFKNLGRRASYQFTSENGNYYSAVATNKLIKDYPDIEAVKTGFTQGAGEAMASKITINGHQIVILVLESKDRENDTLKLKKILSSNFKWD